MAKGEAAPPHELLGPAVVPEDPVSHALQRVHHRQEQQQFAKDEQRLESPGAQGGLRAALQIRLGTH